MHTKGRHHFNHNVRGGLTFALLASACCLALAARAATYYYYWQPVDGEWSGDWTDAAHWRTDDPSGTYPKTASHWASFIDCTLDHPVEVSLGDGTITSKIRWFGTNASEVAFIGNGAASTTLNANSLSAASSSDPIPSNSKVEFRDMKLMRPSWTIVKQVAGVTNVTIRFDGVVETEAKFLQLSAPFSRLEFVDSTIQTERLKVGGTNTVMLVDNSDAISSGSNVQWSGNLQIVFAGKSPSMTYSGSAPYNFAKAKTVRMIFRVPVGGYATVPFTHTKTTEAFLKSGSDKWCSFEMAEDSPAILKGSALRNHVLIQTAAGFSSSYVKDFSPPGKATLSWGVDGEPLADGADLTTARQLLLNLPGSHTIFMVL